jgi:hypothetical protein
MAEPLRLTLISGPAVVPVSLNEAKAHIKVEDNQIADDAIITAQIATAVGACERFTGRALISQTWTLLRDAWPAAWHPGRGPNWDGVREGPISEVRSAARELELPKPPLQQVTHVKTYDEEDTAVLFPATSYFVDTAADPGRIVLRSGAAAPAATRAAGGLEVQFVAGYGDAPHDVPEQLRLGMLQLVAGLNENRGDRPVGTLISESGASALWRPFRVLGV